MEILKPNWPAPKNVFAFFTTRIGGVSSDPWSANNLSFNVGDKLESVQTNWKLLSKKISLPSRPQLLEQIHGIDIVKAECNGSTKIAPKHLNVLLTARLHMILQFCNASCHLKWVCPSC